VALNAHTLQQLKKDFRPKVNGLGSQLTTAVISKAIQIVGELRAEFDNSLTSGSRNKPDKKSEVYKDWDERISRIASIATTLTAATTAQPGGPIGGVSLFISPQTPEKKIARMDHKAAVAEQTVQMATNKLKATQEACQVALTTYQEAANHVPDVHARELVTARLQIESLKAPHLTLVGNSLHN